MGSMFSDAPNPDSSEKAVWMQCSDSRYVRSYISHCSYYITYVLTTYCSTGCANKVATMIMHW